MKYYRVLTKFEYEHNGEKKVRWFRIGEIKETDRGGQYLTLYQQPATDFIIVQERDDEAKDLEVIT